jgi:hypothetical protein
VLQDGVVRGKEYCHTLPCRIENDGHRITNRSGEHLKRSTQEKEYYSMFWPLGVSRAAGLHRG